MVHTCILHRTNECLFFTPLSLRGTENKNSTEPKYNNVYEQRREKPTTLLCTVDECWEFKGISGFFCFSLYSTDSRRTYSQPIHYLTEGIRWHSIADGINIKNYTHSYIQRDGCTHIFIIVSFLCLRLMPLLKWALINNTMFVFQFWMRLLRDIIY